MKKVYLSAALVAATLSSAAIAADWMFVSESVDGTTHWIDRGSMRTMPSGYKRAWVRSHFNKPDRTGDTGAIALNEFDCRERRSRIIQLAWFRGEEATTMINTPSEWRYAVPDAVDTALLNWVCS